jgi:hypothetical protein
MADRVDTLFQEWHRLGGAVLLAEVDLVISARRPEDVIAESTAHCRASGRLTWIVLDWLLHHISDIDEVALFEKTKEHGDITVLGLLCDAAHQRNPNPKLERLIRACRPNSTPEPFFLRVARSPLASRLARENSLEIFRRWNYYSNELRYLSG